MRQAGHLNGAQGSGMSDSERTVLLWFVALVLAVFGALLLLRGQGLLPEDPFGTGYLAGVIQRSILHPFQLSLVAGFIAVVLHLIAMLLLLSRGISAEGYEKLGPWLQVFFTSLGFLGTVVGVSLAVAGLPQAMNDNDPTELIIGLSAAFDTTFIGLSASVLVMIGRQILRFAAAPS